MTLAQRAARAVDVADSADPTGAARAEGPDVRRLRARLARDLAATLGVDPGRVVATADPDRAYGGHAGHLLTVIDTDGAVYRFVPAIGWDHVFLVLGPCPDCGADVPLAEITHLADLGRHLHGGAPRAEELRWDRNHRPGCPHHDHD